MKINISNHASERILERLGCGKNKIEKVSRKAYYSKIFVKNSYRRYRIASGHPKNTYFRYFLGLVFVFAYVGADEVRLITVYKYPRANNVIMK